MKGKDIEPGTLYALRPWDAPGKPLRSVKAIRAEGRSLVYEGPDGEEWHGALSRVAGPWQPHEDALRAAHDATERLYRAHEPRSGEQSVFERAVVVERGYRDFRIRLTCAVDQTQRLAELLSARPRNCDDGGSGAGTPKPPTGSN